MAASGPALDPASIRVADSITTLGPEFRGAVLVAGSHGGRYCGYLAASARLRGVVLNDAGVGKDQAGIGSLAYLEALGVAAATVAHTSARIGDGEHMRAHGEVSHCNRPAQDLGVAVGQSCEEAARAMRVGSVYEGEVPAYSEARVLERAGPPAVLLCDSASLVTESDAGAIIVTGSHGGILAGRPQYGIAAAARAAVFNDAGVGVDEAGIGRLPVLDAHRIAGVTVDAMTAAIGNARSAWETGVVSYLNRQAARAGAEAGMSVQAFVQCVASQMTP